MHTTPRYLDLFAYDRWANRRVVDAIDDDEQLRLFSHILGAQRVWLSRIRGDEGPPPEVWPVLQRSQAADLVDSLSVEWRSLLQGMSDDQLARMVAYTNSQGRSFEDAVGDIMTHVVNHSTYHRAQIARLIAQSGAAVPVTDFIQWSRSGRPE